MAQPAHVLIGSGSRQIRN